MNRVFVVVCALVLSSCLSDTDSTDGPEGHSGMTLHTDNLTGCQYLSRYHGGITPRLDGYGHHIGCKNHY